MNALIQAVWQRRPLSGVTVIDAHAHAGPYSRFFIPDADPTSMVRVMDRCGVSQAVLSSHLAIELDARGGNEATAAAVATFPDRLHGYLTVNPWQDPVAELTRWGNDLRFGGIKLHPDLHAYPLDGPRYAPVWEFAESTKAPVLTHTWAGSDYDDLSMVGAVAEAHPAAVILAGHAGGTPSGLQQAIEVAAHHPNVVLETGTSYGHGDFITRMIDELGSEQVAFGSDFPFLDIRFALGRVLFARLAEADRAAVLGGTMTRLLARRIRK